MLTDERLEEMRHDWLHYDDPKWQEGIELIDEIKRLRSELARYKTPCVDNVTIKEIEK